MDDNFFSGFRMSEGDLESVQAVAGRTFERSPPIAAVAPNWMSRESQMLADLVHPSGDGGDEDKSGAIALKQGPEVGLGFLAFQRGIDCSLGLKLSVCYGQIEFAEAGFLDEPAEDAGACGALGEYRRPGGAAVKAVDGTEFERGPSLGEKELSFISERQFILRRPVYRQTGRFVDNNDPFVFKEYVEVGYLRGHKLPSPGALLDGDRISRDQECVGSRPVAVNGQMPSSNKLPKVGGRCGRKEIPEKAFHSAAVV